MGKRKGRRIRTRMSHTCTHVCTHLALDVAALHGYHAGENSILDKCPVVHKLGGGKCCHGFKETVGSSTKVPDSHGIDPFIGTQTVPPVPVSPLLYQTECAHYVCVRACVQEKGDRKTVQQNLSIMVTV